MQAWKIWAISQERLWSTAAVYCRHYDMITLTEGGNGIINKIIKIPLINCTCPTQCVFESSVNKRFAVWQAGFSTGKSVAFHDKTLLSERRTPGSLCSHQMTKLHHAMLYFRKDIKKSCFAVTSPLFSKEWCYYQQQKDFIWFPCSSLMHERENKKYIEEAFSVFFTSGHCNARRCVCIWS